MPADGVVVRVGIDVRVPHVVILQIVEQVVDQRTAVIGVDPAVGEHVALEPPHQGDGGAGCDLEEIAHAGDRRIDQAEVEDDRVDAGAAVEAVLPAAAGDDVVASAGVDDVEQRVSGQRFVVSSPVVVRKNSCR